MAFPALDESTTRAPRPVATDGLRIRLSGTVQGVGFRPWVYRTARDSGVTGSVRNDAAGVTIEAFGQAPAIAAFVDALRCPPPAARIDDVTYSEIAPQATDAFEIVHSDRGAGRHVSIPPDLAACDECLREIFDPANRRYRYAFTNCTNCGPRFTIANDIPYDRAATTMARFGMCPACRREYKNADDRRFHAQPNACPICGPRLELRAPDGARIHGGDVVALAAGAIADGLVVAVKGLGGFHLACDATSEAAVTRLRVRKRRDEKPLAVMVRDLNEAASLVIVDSVAAAQLTTPERPIVLLPRREPSPIADAVAPGNRMLGVMLPYSPLHHLLLADAGRPLVMTSGNLSDEPIVVDNAEALGRLGETADLFVMHDRDIASRCDDSVVTVIAGHGTVLRRSRGYVPRPVRVAPALVRPVLGCGALLKNTFCLAAGSEAWLGPHIGDLEHLAAFTAYTGAIARMERFLEIPPDVIAYDMHPDYLSTQYARQRPEAIKVAVQHHHAHVVSAMVEHDVSGPAIGIAYDGTGYGTDGTMWGGEVLVATRAAFGRAATFRPLALVGGDRAIREPWRIALALVDDAYGGVVPPEALPLFAAVPALEFAQVRSLLRGRMRFPLARGVGRYFDAFGSLFLGRRSASFEGQVALEWNQAADPRVTRSYPFDVDSTTSCAEIDLRPAVRAAVADHLRGTSLAAIAAAFHNTLAEVTATVVRRTLRQTGALPIVATGGCFQNARLAESVRAALAPEHDVLLHRNVPPGDGGIALGQVVIADAISRGEG
jgi:hydrogenase maturation protein HypF